MKQIELEINSNRQGYKIMVGENILSKIGPELNKFDLGPQAVILADPNVLPLYGRQVQESLSSSGFQVELVSVPCTSRDLKSIESCVFLYDRLWEIGADRNSVLLVLGGGVTSDTVGFVASTYMRGLPVVHLPTTLLSQVDSSIGGKTGIHYKGVSNLIGTYYQPILVMADLNTLSTLPPIEFRSGLAELVKTLFISDKPVSESIRGETEESIRLRLPELVPICCQIKASVVQQDECEKNKRRWILNYGHTIGQAIESASHYSYTHGEAVAIGMIGASYVGESLGITSPDLTRFQAQILRDLSLPDRLTPKHFEQKGLDALVKEITFLVTKDKKANRGNPNFIVLDNIGSPRLARQVPLEVVERAVYRLFEPTI